jgi:hypothetical protein
MLDSKLTTINVPTSNYLGYTDEKAKVDFYIAKAIQLLNDKGYETICCCSGHVHKYNDTMMCGYVWFNCELTSAPYGWYIDDFKMPTGGDTIRYEAKATEKMLKKKMAKLMRWVKSLPYKE